MAGALKTFIFFETGKACRAEFMMKDGQFHATEDAVVIGIERGADEEAAFKRLIETSPWPSEYSFDNIVTRRII